MGGPGVLGLSVYVRLLAYTAGALAAPVLAIVVAAFIYAYVRTVRFTRRKGWQAGQVPHTSIYELYHCSSVDLDAQKVLCCLAEKGVEFKDHEVDPGFFGRFEHLEDNILRINPNGTEPALVHDGHPILGMEEIVNYLEEHVAGPQLRPPSGEERVEMERLFFSHPMVDEKGNPQWTLGMATHLLSVPAISRAATPLTFCGALWAVWRHPNPLPEFGRIPHSLFRHFRRQEQVPPSRASKFAFTVLARSLDDIEQGLARTNRQEFLFGSNFSLADVCLITNLNRLELLGILELLLGDSHPKLRDYWERMKRRDNFKRVFRPKPAYPGLEELAQSFSRFQQAVASHGLAGAYRLDEDGEEEEED